MLETRQSTHVFSVLLLVEVSHVQFIAFFIKKQTKSSFMHYDGMIQQIYFLVKFSK